jgi:ADP-heptose:LPS heptosyltransferase
MSTQPLAFATAKSLGDFVIAHSALHRVVDDAKARIRLISSSCVEGLHSVLPDDVSVTLVNSGGERVPALFDLKKRGAFAATQSALSLRREFQKIQRGHNEALAFVVFGVRERFIAGRWPIKTPRKKAPNIYETYFQFLAEEQIRTTPAPRPKPTGIARSVGIFPESRLVEKRLPAATLSVIFERAALAGLETTLFILDGDVPPQREYPRVVNIPRNFKSLSEAIHSVDSVISADSLPAHLGEYFERPVFVATPALNEYWLPHHCFTDKSWGIFGDPNEFSASLDRFFAALRAV